MATIDYGDPSVVDFTLDETIGLQNLSSTAAGDADDEDISRGSLAALSADFDALLTNLGVDAYANDGRIALSSANLFSVSTDGAVTDISLAGAYDAASETAAQLVNYDGNATAGGATGLTTTSGEAITLFGDYNGLAGALGGNVAFGVDASGDLAFVVLMIEAPQADGTVDLQFAMVTAQAIQHNLDGADSDDAVDLGDFLSVQVDETSGFNFLGVPPGKSLHLTAASTAGDGGVIVTPLTEVVQINTSNAFPDGVIGYGSQGINPGESVVMTWIADGLVDDYTIPNLDQNEADLEANIKFDNLDSVTGASFTIQQKVGGKTAAVSFSALQANNEQDDSGGNENFFEYVGNTELGGAGDDTFVEIISVTLIQNGVEIGTLTGDGDFAGTSVSADFANIGGVTNGEVIVSGIDEGDEFRYTTASPTERLVVTGVSGNVDIGGFSTAQSGTSARPIGDAFVIEDDGVTVDVTIATDVDAARDALSRNLDETIGAIDSLADGEAADGNSDADEVEPTGGVPDYTGALAMGRMTTTGGQLAALFGNSSDFVEFGTDGAGTLSSGGSRDDSVAFSLSSASVETNLIATPVVGSVIDTQTDAQRTVYLSQDTDGNILGTTQAGTLVVKMTLNNADDPTNATITYEQFVPVQNPDPTLYDEEVVLNTVAGESLSIVWSTEAADGDNDEDSDSESVVLIDDTDSIMSIDDDGPRVGSTPRPVPLWEDALDAGISDGDPGETAAGGGNLATQVIAGQDGIKSIGLVDPGAPFNSGLTSGGVDVFYSVSTSDGDDTLVASAGGDTIFTVTVGEDGTFTTSLVGTLDHPDTLTGQKDNDVLEVNLTDLLYAIEGDDDPANFLDDALVLRIEDDAAEIAGLDDTPVIPYANGSPIAMDIGFVDYGADGPGSLAITGFTPTLITGDEALGTVTGSIIGGDLIYASSVFGDIISIAVDGSSGGSYSVDVLQDAPLIEVALIDGATTPGGPIEDVTLSGGATEVVFDGYLFGASPDEDQQALFDGGGDDNAGPNDDVNISSQGAAVKDNQFDEGEGLAMFFVEDVAGAEFIIQGGTGGKASGTIYVTGYNDGVLVETAVYDKALPKGNNTLDISFMPSAEVDEIYISHDFQAPNGFRIPEIFAFTYADIPDLTGTVELTATDFDGDTAVDEFQFFIDGDGDMIA